MDVTSEDLKHAANEGLITGQQAQALWAFWQERKQDVPRFQTAHILYYLGGLLAMGAMSLFMNLAWQRMGGWGLTGIALAYAVAGVWLTEYWLSRRQWRIPAGISAAFVVVLTPLAVYGVQLAMGWWETQAPYRDYHRLIDGRWLAMELLTLVVGVAMLWRYRLPFLVMPLAVTLWYMSMDLTPWLLTDPDVQWALRKWVSLWFGLGMVLLAVCVDLRVGRKPDFTFWLYHWGALAFWVALSWMDSGNEMARLAYMAVNLLLIAAGAVLARRVFAVLGGLGVAGYVGHLAYRVFQDSLLFPLVLTAIGLAVVYLGILWQRHELSISQTLGRLLPAQWQSRVASWRTVA